MKTHSVISFHEAVKAIKEVYDLMGTESYGRFIHHVDSREMMNANWAKLGQRFQNVITSEASKDGINFSAQLLSSDDKFYIAKVRSPLDRTHRHSRISKLRAHECNTYVQKSPK